MTWPSPDGTALMAMGCVLRSRAWLAQRRNLCAVVLTIGSLVPAARRGGLFDSWAGHRKSEISRTSTHIVTLTIDSPAAILPGRTEGAREAGGARAAGHRKQLHLSGRGRTKGCAASRSHRSHFTQPPWSQSSSLSRNAPTKLAVGSKKPSSGGIAALSLSGLLGFRSGARVSKQLPSWGSY